VRSEPRPDRDSLEARLARAWSSETSSLWSADNPALGQCSVTAIAVQRLCGGEILMTPMPGGTHFYNRVGGERWDLTARQFDRLPVYEDRPSDAAAALADTSAEQVAALLDALERGS
jgi:hypothetical protein